MQHSWRIANSHKDTSMWTCTIGSHIVLVMDWNTTEYTFFMIMYVFVAIVILELFKELKTTQCTNSNDAGRLPDKEVF